MIGISSSFSAAIQIQHLLKLNVKSIKRNNKAMNSNTTFVKVKLVDFIVIWPQCYNSNTTFVKVKFDFFILFTYNREFKYNIC